MTLLRWAWRVLKKGVWLLAFLPALLDFVSTYRLPAQLMPDLLLKLLEEGVSWQLTLVLVVLGLIASAFWVHVEDRRELQRRHSELQALQDSQPRLVVGFQSGEQPSTSKLQIRLNPIPPITGVDELVEQERKELLAKRRRHDPSAIFAALEPPNPNYAREVEQYLVDYREYRMRTYERAIQRAYPVHPVLQNSGPCEVTNITLEFKMPPAYQTAVEYQCRGASWLEKDLVEAGLSVEEAQEHATQILCDRPRKPEPFVTLAGMVTVPDIGEGPPRFSPLDPFEPRLEGFSNPAYEERDSRWFVTYELDRLVPGQTEADFAPFWLWLGSIRHSIMWHIPVTLRATELRESVEQVLTLDIQVLPEES